MLRDRTDKPRQLRRRARRFLRRALGDKIGQTVASRVVNPIELRLLLRRLSVSSTPEHREVARRLASALRRGDQQAALAIATNARQEPDTRSEKIVSHRYGFVWICNPKVASRSIVQALLAVDAEATLIRGQTMDELYAADPEARRFVSFAFVRDPCERARSFFDDKLDLGPLAPDWNSHGRYYGLHKGMSFDDYCRWLDTPFGSDAFAERHWLSQYKHLEVNGGLPDYIGSYENLQEDWRCMLAQLGVHYRELPHLNKRRSGAVRPEAAHTSEEISNILHRRYARDFELFREVGSRGMIRGHRN